MSTPGPQGVQPSAGSITAQMVIDMFAELTLPVCDDESAIQQKVKEQRDRRLRDTNSTNVMTKEKTQRWFKDVESMQDARRRQSLLQIVYERFKDLANSVISVATAAKQSTVTQQLIDDLITMAR